MRGEEIGASRGSLSGQKLNTVLGVNWVVAPGGPFGKISRDSPTAVSGWRGEANRAESSISDSGVGGSVTSSATSSGVWAKS